MARTTLATQADEAGETPAPTPAPQPAPPQVVLSMARIGMIMRIITLAFLILSVSLLASNSTTIRLDDNSTTTIHFNDIYAYRSVLFQLLLVAELNCIWLWIEIKYWLLQVCIGQWRDRIVLHLLALAFFNPASEIRNALPQPSQIAYVRLSWR